MKGEGHQSGITRRGTFGLAGASVVALPAISWPFGSNKLQTGDEILVNQIGYLKNGPKRMGVRSSDLKAGNTSFEIFREDTDQKLGRLDVTLAVTSDSQVGTANFSSFQTAGRFYLKSGNVRSLSFEVARAPFAEVERSLLRAFYIQRCGVALADPVTGAGHGLCHASDALSVDGGSHRDCTGGWHDAGDFGKYVATTAVSIGEILSLHEEHRSVFGDGELDLPESGDGTPDVLSEMRIGLAWLLKMQEPYGAFARKVSGRTWPSMTQPPENDQQPRFAFSASTADTAKAAAALAIAARVFEPLDKLEAQRYLSASTRAYDYLHRNSGAFTGHSPGDDTGSGAYLNDTDEPEDQDAGDRLWLAAELYLTTGDKKYGKDFASRTRKHILWPASWANPSAIGMLNVLRDRRRRDVDGMRTYIHERLLARADEFEKTTRLAPWKTADLKFGWGSNRNLAARGRILIAAFEETGEPKYLDAAVAQSNYVFGMNPLSISYVSGTGSRSVQNIHHRLLLALRQKRDDFVLPGLLVGGPNEQAASDGLGKRQGAERYVDDPSAFEANEFAIDHNAALLSLLVRLSRARAPQRPGLWSRLRRAVGL